MIVLPLATGKNLFYQRWQVQVIGADEELGNDKKKKQTLLGSSCHGVPWPPCKCFLLKAVILYILQKALPKTIAAFILLKFSWIKFFDWLFLSLIIHNSSLFFLPAIHWAR
jgi:hypothetical protein